MKNLSTTSLILAILLFSCANNSTSKIPVQHESNNGQQTVLSDRANDSFYVFTGFYFLADNNRGIKMRKSNSNEDYYISKIPFVSIKNILRATAQKNVVQGRDIYGTTIVLDNAGTKDLEQGTGNPSHPYIAVVIANRLLYVVENAAQIKTGVMQIALDGYSEEEVNEMITAINQKR